MEKWDHIRLIRMRQAFNMSRKEMEKLLNVGAYTYFRMEAGMREVDEYTKQLDIILKHQIQVRKKMFDQLVKYYKTL